MASSRIFVKGLPPTFTDAEFKKHFSSQREITDAKIFPNRRIGYVGYKTPEDAQKAVKYYNKTFIRMSRITVETARPIQDGKSVAESALTPTAREASDGGVTAAKKNSLKRKRPSESEEQQDPKLKEFLEAMKPKSKRKTWEVDEAARPIAVDDKDIGLDANQSDEEYEDVPKKGKKSNPLLDTNLLKPEESASVEDDPAGESHDKQASVESAAEGTEIQRSAVSDSDWARSRTSRLLGLLDEDEETAVQQPDQDDTGASEDDPELEKGTSKKQHTSEPESSMPTPPSENGHEDSAKPSEDPDVDPVRSSMRLFVRNLPYDVKGEDLEAEFAPFGNLDEVGLRFPLIAFRDEQPDRDSLCYGI